MSAPPERWLEDFQPGDVLACAGPLLTRDAAVAFARDFDPQPFHLDDAAAAASPFGELVASGWHTVALTMRALVDSGHFRATGILGVAVDELRWPRATRPGDRLQVRAEVLEKRPSSSRPDRGTMRMKVTTLDQDGAELQSFIATLIMPRRPA